MNNLAIFRRELEKHLPDGLIENSEHWHETMEHLCDIKLLHPSEVKTLNLRVLTRNFPISIPEFEETIMKEFGSQESKSLLQDLTVIQKKIEQAKGVLSIWNEKGISPAEAQALEILFAKGNSKMESICRLLQDKKTLMESVSEQEVQMIKAMEEWLSMQKIVRTYRDYQEYLQINKKAIEHLINQIKVREVHFKTKKGSKSTHDISVVVGFNSKDDEPVEVTKIHKKSMNFQQVNRALVTFNAHRDLSLSPYFLRFRGSNPKMDDNYLYYFREYIEAKNMADLLRNSQIRLEDSMSIFRFWAGQFFRALKDVYQKCSYQPIFPIKLQHFYVSDFGLRVILKDMAFDAPRKTVDALEPILLENLGSLILELLQISPAEVQSKFKSIENVCLLTCLLRARQGHQLYQDGIVSCCARFFNLQTHPLFESNQETEGLEIVDNYLVLFGDIQ